MKRGGVRLWADQASRAGLGRRLLTAAFIAGAVIAMSGSLGSWLRDYDGWVCRSGDYHVAEGEALLHGIPAAGVSFSMPGFSIPDALLGDHSGAPLQMLARSLCLLACAVLVFGLGCLLHSGVCGGAATLLFVLLMPPTLSSDRWLYTLHLLVVAYALVWRVQAPSLPRSLLLGLAIGMSLLVLSPLFLLPLALAVYEWGRRPASGVEERTAWRRQIIGIWAVPFACLLPWLLMNWRFHHRLILFEDGRARNNIITGALGFVSTGVGNWEAVARGIPIGRGVIWWAAREVMRHPPRYLAACGERLLYAISFSPALFLLGLVAVWLLRKREEHRQLALLVGYFVGIHCLMSVEKKHFEPLLPLLAVMGACAALSWLKPAAERSGGFLRAGPLYGVLAPLAVLQLYVLAAVISYPGRAAQAAPLERELANDPADPGLWAEAGERSLEQGQAQDAVADFAKALARAPQRPEWRMRYAWARMAQGGPGVAIWDRLHLEMRLTGPFGGLWQAFRTVYFLQQGRLSEARGSLSLMRDIRRLPSFFKESDNSRVQERLNAAARLEAQDFDGVLACWPVSARQRLSGSLAGLLAEKPMEGDRLGELWLQEAWSALQSGQIGTASAALERAQRLPLGPEQTFRWRLAESYCGMGGHRRASQALGALFGPGRDSVRARYARALGELGIWIERHPEDGELLFEWADAAKTAGLEGAALEVLGLARILRLDVAQIRRAAALYEALDRPRQAREMLGRLMGLPEEDRLQDPRLLLAVADDAVRVRHRALALRCVAQARRQGLNAEDLGRVAVVYQEFGEYRRALEVLDGLIRVEPRQARWRSDRGVLHMLMGMRDGAVMDWQQAVVLEPGSLSAILSLGSLYAASGRRAEALKLYQAALRQPLSKDPKKKDIQERIRKECDRLRSEGRKSRIGCS